MDVSMAHDAMPVDLFERQMSDLVRAAMKLEHYKEDLCVPTNDFPI
jgi:hypothetical protein